MLQAAQEIDQYGDPQLTKDIIDVLIKHFDINYKIATGEIDPEEYRDSE